MNTLKFLYTPTNSSVALAKAGDILVSVFHNNEDEGTFFIEVLTKENNFELLSIQSFMPGTIMNTFNLCSNSFLTYIS